MHEWTDGQSSDWEDNLWSQKNPGSNPSAVADLLCGHKQVEPHLWAWVPSSVKRENAPYLLGVEVEGNTHRKYLTRQPPPGRPPVKGAVRLPSDSLPLRVPIVLMQCSITAPTTLAAMPPPQRAFPPHNPARAATPLLSSRHLLLHCLFLV